MMLKFLDDRLRGAVSRVGANLRVYFFRGGDKVPFYLPPPEYVPADFVV